MTIEELVESYGVTLAYFDNELWPRPGIYISEIKIIFINKSLSEEAMKKVVYHELGHLEHDSNQYQRRHEQFELQASLSNTSAGTRNGILGVVLPELYDKIYKGQQACSQCFKNHNIVVINENTTIREFSYNYYLPLDNGEHVWSEDDRYCVLVKWEDFIVSPDKYIEQAFNKRASDIAKKIKVRP